MFEALLFLETSHLLADEGLYVDSSHKFLYRLQFGFLFVVLVSLPSDPCSLTCEK